jgi:hypothetical protein
MSLVDVKRHMSSPATEQSLETVLLFDQVVKLLGIAPKDDARLLEVGNQEVPQPILLGSEQCQVFESSRRRKRHIGLYLFRSNTDIQPVHEVERVTMPVLFERIFAKELPQFVPRCAHRHARSDWPSRARDVVVLNDPGGQLAARGVSAPDPFP